MISASAADLPPVSQGATPIVEGFGRGWYLRGDIGFSTRVVGKFSNPQGATMTAVRYLDRGVEAPPFAAPGMGYQLPSWLRAALTRAVSWRCTCPGF